tara:strand:+ start:21102 stop:21995 length:894 start_codon:yes stop_codon:yes gene_type:complete
MNDLLEEIQSKIESKILLNYDMSTSTWFRAGGIAKGYVIIKTISDLKKIISYSDQIQYYIIGAGSNLLVRDGGFNGLIIKLGKNFNKIKLKKNLLSVGGGVLDLNLSKFALKNSIKDFEFFSGIPGTVGGAIKMNAGCFGAQTSDILKSALIINKYGKINLLNCKDLKLGYRTSDIDQNSVVLQANFSFEYTSKSDILEKHKFIKSQRINTQPIKEKTSGSSFKNPKDGFAAVLIEQAGCKGMQFGGATISNVHSNFIINHGKAKASDIEELGKSVIRRVKKKFGIELEWEIKIIGK